MNEQDSLIKALIALSADLSSIRGNADSLIRVHSPDSLKKHQIYVQKIETLSLSGAAKEAVKTAHDNLNRLLRNTIPLYKEKYSEFSFGILMYQRKENRFQRIEEEYPGYQGWKKQMKKTWNYLKKEEDLLKYYTSYYGLFNSNK